MHKEFVKARDTIFSLTELRPEILIILGSGLGTFIELVQDRISLPYANLFPFQKPVVEGHGGLLHIGHLHGTPIYCMQGRNHYYEGYSDQEIRFPIQLFAHLGVKTLLVTNACGGMNPELVPGDLMLIADHINMIGRNPMIGATDYDLGPRFFDMSEPYSLKLIALAERIGKKQGIGIKKGVYVGYSGPSYETKAEIAAFRMLGGDAVGMSTVPEVIVANQCGMEVLGISCITNMATGMQKRKLTHSEVIEVANQAGEKLSRLLSGIVFEIGKK